MRSEYNWRMDTPHHIFSLTNSRAEMFTTDLGLAAYQGKRDEIKKALEQGIDWTEQGPYLLSAAIFGQQWDIARDVLRAGMPISDATYLEIYNWGDHSLLEELPPRPDILSPLIENAQRHSFFRAIIEGDLAETKRLFHQQWINAESNILADHITRRPLHYAARSCHRDLIEYLLKNGSEVNALTGDGQSALALISRCPSVENNVRRECFKLVRSHGGEMIPAVKGWFKNWCLARGSILLP